MAMRVASGSDLDSEAEEIVAEINITPLVDIFLVILIIFMVTSSAMVGMGMEVSLPKASGKVASNQPEGVIVTLKTDGGILVNQQAIPADDFGKLTELVHAAFEKTQSRLVVLEGDRRAMLGKAIEVMDAAKRAGADRFAIATEAKE